MGFLERLKQDRFTRERQERDNVVISLQSAKVQRQIEERARQEIWKQRKIAESYLNRSAFSRLCKELAELTDWHEGIYGPGLPPGLIDDRSGRIVLQRKHHRSYTYRYIIVESRTDGIIRVRGGFLGSTILNPNQWTNSIDLQESALEKAFHHPMTVTYKPESRGGGDTVDGPNWVGSG